MERYKDLNTKLKLAKVFKAVISAGLVAPVFVSVSACEKTKPAVEETQAAVTVPTTIETTTETTVAPTTETTPETTAEVIIFKEKVSFISEALPGAELNIKTGELTAKAENEWGIKEGENIGWYVVNAYKEIAADGVEKEQDAIGLIPKVADYQQKKLFEETGEYSLPFIIDPKENPGVKITELKAINPDFLSFANVLGINVLPGTKVIAPIEGEWYSNFEALYTKEETEERNFFAFNSLNSSTDAQYIIDFMEGEVIPEIKIPGITKDPETNEDFEDNIYKVKFGDPVIEITGETFLDSAANKVIDRTEFKDPGDYQLMIIALLTTVSHGENNDGPDIENKPINILKVGQGEEQKIVFILNNPQETAQ